MTTKDQAIAPKVMLFNPYTGRPRHPSDIQSDPQGILIADPEAGSLRAYKPPAPDCRTCEYMWIDIDLEKATSKESCARPGGAVCINGSLHKPAPAVVLWRTEQ